MDHIGIDVHKNASQVCIRTETGQLIERRVRTDRESFAKWLGKRDKARILVESSTESEWVARCLEELGHEVIVADPNFAPMYAQRSRKVKTDRRDARALCEACALGAYRPAHRSSDRSRALRAQVAVREALVQTRTRHISLIRALLRQQGYRMRSGGGGLLCIFALSPTEVWLCAGNDVLFYDGATFTAMDVSTPTGLDGITDVWASSQTDVWAVGDDAIVAHYDGIAWGRTIAGSPFKSSIWGSGPTDVYALSTFDLIHYDGLGWTEIELDAGGGDGQVWGTGASDVWVMTDSSEMSHFDGASWQTIDTFDFVGDLAAVWGPAADDLWAAGSAGAIAHYDGNSWTQVAHQPIGAPYLRLFLAVHGTSSTDVWAVGQQLGEGGSTALIYHYQP